MFSVKLTFCSVVYLLLVDSLCRKGRPPVLFMFSFFWDCKRFLDSCTDFFEVMFC